MSKGAPFDAVQSNCVCEHFSGTKCFFYRGRVLQGILRQEGVFGSFRCHSRFPKQNQLSLVAQELVCSTWLKVHIHERFQQRCQKAYKGRKGKFSLKKLIFRIHLLFRFSYCWPGQSIICSSGELFTLQADWSMLHGCRCPVETQFGCISLPAWAITLAF